MNPDWISSVSVMLERGLKSRRVQTGLDSLFRPGEKPKKNTKQKETQTLLTKLGKTLRS